MKPHTITPFLWFDGQAAEAAKFYCSVFANSKILGEVDFDNVLTGAKNAVNTVTFEINGLRLTAFNGGPMYKFNEFGLSVRRLRDAGRGRLLLGQIHLKRRHGIALRLAQR